MIQPLGLVAIIGPTAAGKTAISIRLAERLGGEIVSADSRLVYRGMDIGTAKPSADDQRRVRHWLVDMVEPGQEFSLAAYRRAALAAIETIQAAGRLPFLVGGTGQYVTSVLEGWSPPPAPEDRVLRQELQAFADQHGPAALHARLKAIDPVRARAIDARNVRRVIRALEIYETTGELPSRARRRQPPPYHVLKIGLTLPRPELYARIDQRIETMLAAGWLEEVRRLLEAGLPLDAPAFSAIGYRPLADVLLGKRSLEDAKASIRRASRQFVRRQANWFKPGDASIHWFEARLGVERAMEALIAAAGP